MNTEKLEKLKKSLDNKFIPDNMKDKIRAEIKKLEADIKTDETITATEVKEEVKEIEKKVEKALEVAEEKEEQVEAKKEEAEEKAEAKAEEKKAKKSRTKTTKTDEKPKSAKKSVFSIAKEIRKENESWEDAKERARKMMKSETTETKKKTKTETDKLLAMVRRNKEYKKLAGTSNLAKDASRRALPRGKRISKITGDVYYENRANRVDVGGFKNAYLAKGGEIEMENSNLYFVGRGRDVNGNKVIKISFPNQKPFSIQTLGNLPKTHRIFREYDNDKDITPEEIDTIEREVISYVEEFGSKKQKESLRKYEGGGYANKGVYVETLDEEIDLTDDGKVRARKTQEGGNKSFGERREMHGASPEALAFDNGGSVEDEKFKKFINSQVSYIISLKTISQKREPIQNLLDNMEDYRSGSEIVKRITTDNLKYALQQKTVSKMNEVLRISLNALQYANGGRTRERRYVNHSQDYEVRYSKDKPHRRGYGYAEGGTIIGTPETPLARDLGIDYTGLVGETGAMSSGEMFADGGATGLPAGAEQHFINYYLGEGTAQGIYAEGGSIGQMVNFEDWQLYDRDTNLERMKKSCNAIRKNGFKAIVVEDKGMYYVLYKSMSDSEGKRVFAEGGSLGNHGLKQGDEIIKTMSGGVQKVKTKNGDIVYVNLANGYRGAEPPLPFAKGGYTNERRHVNKSQDYEVRYAKNKPNRTGYLGKRSFDDGGQIEKSIRFTKNDYERLVRDSSEDYPFYSTKNGINQEIYKEKDEKKVAVWNSNKEILRITNDSDLIDWLERNSYNVRKYDDGGFMTDPNFGDFQSGVYATGGVTKNYINRNQLNTITIKKGDKKLTYKVSDVYNGAYKLEEGGNLEKTAFYVPKRNVVKVQLKDGKDVKVANGYWIKKGAKPIHTSKYDDGGEMEYANGGGFGKVAFEISNDYIGNLFLGFYDVEINEEFNSSSAFMKYSDAIESLIEYLKSEDGIFIAKEYPKSKFEIDMVSYNSKLDKYKNLEPQRKTVLSVKASMVKDFTEKRIFEGGGKTTFKEKSTAIAKKFEGKKVEPKYQKEYGKTYDKAEAKEVGNKIAGSQKAKYDSKMSGGGSTKRGGAMQLAKQIRKDGESWQSALKRANEQMRNK